MHIDFTLIKFSPFLSFYLVLFPISSFFFSIPYISFPVNIRCFCLPVTCHSFIMNFMIWRGLGWTLGTSLPFCPQNMTIYLYALSPSTKLRDHTIALIPPQNKKWQKFLTWQSKISPSMSLWSVCKFTYHWLEKDELKAPPLTALYHISWVFPAIQRFKITFLHQYVLSFYLYLCNK